ncbi:hypothetical protein PSPO01_00629 [Paraphaeosphaeria sporulosa]
MEALHAALATIHQAPLDLLSDCSADLLAQANLGLAMAIARRSVSRSNDCSTDHTDDCGTKRTINFSAEEETSDVVTKGTNRSTPLRSRRPIPPSIPEDIRPKSIKFLDRISALASKTIQSGSKNVKYVSQAHDRYILIRDYFKWTDRTDQFNPNKFDTKRYQRFIENRGGSDYDQSFPRADHLLHRLVLSDKKNVVLLIALKFKDFRRLASTRTITFEMLQREDLVAHGAMMREMVISDLGEYFDGQFKDSRRKSVHSDSDREYRMEDVETRASEPQREVVGMKQAIDANAQLTRLTEASQAAKVQQAGVTEAETQEDRSVEVQPMGTQPEVEEMECQMGQSLQALHDQLSRNQALHALHDRLSQDQALQEWASDFQWTSDPMPPNWGDALSIDTTMLPTFHASEKQTPLQQADHAEQ